MSEIELLSIAFEVNLHTDRCFASEIEIVLSIFVIFLLSLLPPAVNAVDIKTNKPFKLTMGAPTIIPIPLRETARLLVENTADVTPITVNVVRRTDLIFFNLPRTRR